MENGSILRALGQWEVIAACLFLMLLLPLIFFIASAKRQDSAPAKAPARPERRKSDSRETAEEENGDSPQ